MCGVLGYVSPAPSEAHFLRARDIIEELKTRGVHAFGVTFARGGELHTRKDLRPLPDSAIREAVAAGAFIYHCRYSTSGDWRDQRNNQPLVFDGFALAVNGVTSMAPKEEYEERFDILCETDNDAEILGRLLERGVSPYELLQRSDLGSMAVLLLRANGTLWSGRNLARPLRYLVTEDATWAASTTAAMMRGFGDPGALVLPGAGVEARYR